MTYFSNGTDFERFRASNCARCANLTEDEYGEGCPIIDLHYLWNYEAADETDEVSKTKREALDFLIAGNGIESKRQCAMFRERERETTFSARSHHEVLGHPWMIARENRGAK